MSKNMQATLFENFGYEWHKTIYQDESATAQERNTSGQWLIHHGFIGLDGKMIRVDFK